MFDPARGVDEIHRVVVVLFDAGSHRENIRVENNIFRWEADLFGEELVRARTNIDFALIGIGLASFVKGHHHRGRAVTAAQFGALDKFGLAFLHRNRIDNALALDALQAGFDHAPL